MGFVAGISDAPRHAPHSRVQAHTSERTDKMQNLTQSGKAQFKKNQNVVTKCHRRVPGHNLEVIHAVPFHTTQQSAINN